MLFQFEVTRFPYNNNSPSSSRGRRIYATPLPECEQLNFFLSSSSWHSLCFGSFAREIRFKKRLDFGWTGALFSPIFDFPAIFFFFCRFDFIYFDTFTKNFQPRAHAHRGSSGSNDTTSSSCGSARVNERLEELLSGKKKVSRVFERECARANFCG
jgi:hypothetical protein